MTNLLISSNQPDQSVPVRSPRPAQDRPSLLSKWRPMAMLVFSFIGFVDATYLTIQHYSQGILPCVLFKGCDQVLTSPYAVIKGLPISLWGAIYYLTIFLAAIFFIDTKSRKSLLILSFLPIAGFVASLVLVYLQIFVIKALCTYCVVSALSSTILFFLGLQVWKRSRKSPGDGGEQFL